MFGASERFVLVTSLEIVVVSINMYVATFITVTVLASTKGVASTLCPCAAIT